MSYQIRRPLSVLKCLDDKLLADNDRMLIHGRVERLYKVFTKEFGDVLDIVMFSNAVDVLLDNYRLSFMPEPGKEPVYRWVLIETSMSAREQGEVSGPYPFLTAKKAVELVYDMKKWLVDNGKPKNKGR